MTTQMLKYIKSIIDETYAMEVLYYYIKKTIANNDFTLNGVAAIEISNKFMETPVVININHMYNKQLDAFALLLSIRALMIDKGLLAYCESDKLLFDGTSIHNFEWLKYTSIIMDCMKDEEFSGIYSILVSAYSNNLSINEKTRFEESISTPNYKNILGYYKAIASQENGETGVVICNNAFICDNNLTEYIIDEGIAYVGNTAFSYCPKLTKIIIKRNNTIFGKFPIIECANLKRIIVPIGSEEYYKQALPYFKNIIFSNEAITEETCDNEPINGEKQYDSTSLHKTDFEIDTHKLKTLFDKKVTSYKYFWFMSIISLLKEKKELTISFDDLVFRMAAQAWPIVIKDGLDLGTRDMLKKYLKDVKNYTSLSEDSTSQDVESWLHNCSSTNVKNCLAPLLKNVPFRFLSPWIKYTSNDEVIAKSNKTEYETLYALQNNQIVMDEDWFDYILKNYDEIYKFAKDSLGEYLKQYNNDLAMIGFYLRI